jgi:hypothetical protein
MLPSNLANCYRLLAALPALPSDVNYRFVRHELILHDTRANLILDRVDDAITCK